MSYETDLDIETEVFASAIGGSRSGPVVVAVGGGSGLAQCLRAITRYAGVVTAIVTVADDGGSSGRLAPALDIPPPGDIRQCLIALTPEDSPVRQIFTHRFAGGDVAGHSLGNLILAALASIEGDFEAALRRAGDLLGASGVVLPAAPQRIDLTAIIDGEKVEGQANISRARGRIEELILSPSVEASPSAIAALLAADQIVLGPGSLYTSVMAAMLVPGITEAINESDAQLVYVANLITQDGETLQMDGADHLDALLHMTGVRSPSAIVGHTGPIVVEPPLQAVAVDREAIETYGVDVVGADLRDPAHDWPRHDPARLGGVLARLLPAD